jgi:propionate CoA-transferase
MTAHEAARLIRNGSCVISCGLDANMRCSIFYWAIREEFERRHHPCNLTWIGIGGMGGRGRAPGTVEEVGLKGLVTRYIGGHLETSKSLLALAQAGHCELQTLPQGVLALAIEAQGRGDDSLLSRVGIGSFVDPRVGTGTAVGPGACLVTVEGDQLRYRIPKIDVALFIAPAADAEGNIYMTNASTLTESLEGARAARKNGGKVLVSVAEIIPKDASRIFLPASEVDAVVVHPWNEQTGAVPQRQFRPMFVPGYQVDVAESVEELKFINNLLGITPRRTAVDHALARQAATLFTRWARPGAAVNIGVGLPEEVCRLISESALFKDVTFLLETGVFGGLPAPGVFFGTAIQPQRSITSAEIFHYMEEHLDVTVLGMLQADEHGNVNVSKRGSGPMNYVGPGGFIDLTTAAKTVLFVGSWMAGARMSVEGGKWRLVKPGRPKFIKAVDEVTFCGSEAVKRGQHVFYVTNVGTFQLTARGMELIEVVPGVDIERDILNGCPMQVVVPERPALVERSTLTGEQFALAWRSPVTPARSA